MAEPQIDTHLCAYCIHFDGCKECELTNKEVFDNTEACSNFEEV